MIEQIRNFFLPRHNVAEIIKSAPKMDSWKAYAGDFPLPLRANKVDPNGDDNILLPIVGELIDASTAHMLGNGVDLSVQDENEPAQQWLDDFLTRSKVKTTIQKLALNAAVCGHGFVKLIIKDGVPDRFQVINSAMVTVDTDPRDTEMATSFTINWEKTDAKNKTVKYQETTRRAGDFWVIEEYESQGNGRMTLVSSTEWPFQWSPIFDCQNLTNPIAYWGKPDCPAAAINQNETVNNTLSMLARLLRTHSHPKTILMGINGRPITWETNEVLSLLPDSSTSQMEMSAAGAGALLDLYRELRDELHTTTRTPTIASGKLENIGAISGVALTILYKPLDAKTNEKRNHLGEMLESLCERALELAGYEGVSVAAVFPNTTPSSELEDRQTAQSDIAMGIASRKTISAKLGYDYAVESVQIEAEQAANEVELPPAPAPTPLPIAA